MGLSAIPNKRPLRQIQTVTSELVKEGKSDEAQDVWSSALSAVLVRNAKLELLVKKLRAANAGKGSSERLDPGQLLLLFEMLEEEEESEPTIEVEAAADAELDKEIQEAKTEESEKPKTERKRRKALSTEGLEERHSTLAIPEEKKEWEVVGEDITKRLRFSPAQFFVEVLHSPILRDPQPQEDGSLGDSAVPVPATVVPGGMAGNDVIAMLLIRKFEEHTPLHRLHRQFLREQGVSLPVSTLADWVAWGGRALERLSRLLLMKVVASPLVQMDATGMRVLDSGPDNVHRGTFHAYLGRSGEPGDAPDIVFQYTPTGKADVGPWQVLAGYDGYIVADASNSFDRLFNGQVANAKEVGCHFHARRAFKANDDDPRSAFVLQLVRRLYRLETLADAKHLTGQDRTRFRQQRSKPVLKKLYRYLKKLARDTTPTDPIGKAARYYTRHQDALTRFVTDGRLPLDNNDVERLFRGLRIGERNFLFAGSDDAAIRMAAIYSVLATAKAHGINLLDYLCDILDKLAHPMNEIQVAELLPHRWKLQQANTATDQKPP